MSKKQTTVRLDFEVYDALDKVSQRRKIPLNEVINEACENYVRVDGEEMLDRIYAPIMERYMQHHFKAFENRFAALMAKNALDSSMSMFMLLESISKSRKQDPEDLYQTMRKVAVKHVQKREELLDMVKEKYKTE